MTTSIWTEGWFFPLVLMIAKSLLVLVVFGSILVPSLLFAWLVSKWVLGQTL